MCDDMCGDVCVDMCVDMCADMSIRGEVISTDEQVNALLKDSTVSAKTLWPWQRDGYVTNASCLGIFRVARILSRKDSWGQSLLNNAIHNNQKAFIASAQVNTYIRRLWWGVDANTLTVHLRGKLIVVLVSLFLQVSLFLHVSFLQVLVFCRC